jgi:hypothetical protein
MIRGIISDVIRKLQPTCRRVIPKGCGTPQGVSTHPFPVYIFRGPPPYQSSIHFAPILFHSVHFSLNTLSALPLPWDARTQETEAWMLCRWRRTPSLDLTSCKSMMSTTNMDVISVVGILHRDDTTIWVDRSIFMPSDQELHWWSLLNISKLTSRNLQIFGL